MSCDSVGRFIAGAEQFDLDVWITGKAASNFQKCRFCTALNAAKSGRINAIRIGFMLPLCQATYERTRVIFNCRISTIARHELLNQHAVSTTLGWVFTRCVVG